MPPQCGTSTGGCMSRGSILFKSQSPRAASALRVPMMRPTADRCTPRSSDERREERRDLPLAPGLTAFLVNARDARGMGQEETALELGMSDRQYRVWESARQAIPRTRLDDLARALHLDEVGRRQLYRLTGHLVPLPGALSGNARLLELTERWANVHIHRQSDPACLTDGAWNVVAANDAYFRLFEAVSPHPLNHPTVNTLRWTLFHPDAPHMLGKWRDSWMLPALSQFALVFQNTQTDPQLRRIREEIARHPDLEEAYLRKVPDLLAQPTEYPDDEDGVVREILVGAEGYASALLTTAIPSHARDHGFRAVTMSVIEREGAADPESEEPTAARQHAHHGW
ncbi:MmyB family transcriptional regulator [Streptomyces sp. NPDC001709]